MLLGLGAVVRRRVEGRRGAGGHDAHQPVWMSGYASRSTPSQGVAHPLAAKVPCWPTGKGPGRPDHLRHHRLQPRLHAGRVTDRVKDKYGLPRENVVLFASHCHSGPTPVESLDRLSADGEVRDKAQNNVDYTRDLENKLVELVGAALSAMEPARLSYGVGRAHFALNRREPTATGIKLGKNPAGPTDESVPILRVQGAGGSRWPSSSATPATTPRTGPT